MKSKSSVNKGKVGRRWALYDKRAMDADLIVAEGVIVKNRFGPTGVRTAVGDGYYSLMEEPKEE